MTDVPLSDEERLARRYPKRSPLDYLLFGGLGIGVVGAIVIAVLSGLQQSDPPVVAMVRNFEVSSPTEVQVELVVQRTDPTQSAQCSVFAQAVSFEEVGETVVDIPGGDEWLEPFEFTLATVKEATAVDVEGCRLSPN